MRITEFPTYKQLMKKFESGEFKKGVEVDIPWDEVIQGKFTLGYYINELEYSRIRLKNIPKACLTREFFINTINTSDVVDYVKKHLGQTFDRDFFKDAIAKNYSILNGDDNIFDYMPIEYIDEEMIACAWIGTVESHICRCNCADQWIYSVAKRKPEILKQDFWTLGALIMAEKRHGKNKFLDITPEQYKTEEYYYAMCMENDTPVMEDFPKEILTTNFLVNIINDDVKNIECFSEETLERKAPMTGQSNEVKFWQAAILIDGTTIKYSIPLNDERIAYFMEHYDKDSYEYRCFKKAYKRYLKENSSKQKNKENETAGSIMLLSACCGVDLDRATYLSDSYLKNETSNIKVLPIDFIGRVPVEFCKKYDQEEYLCEIYKKLGIKILDEHNEYYYKVVLPSKYKIDTDHYGTYYLKDGDKVILKYIDIGSFYDREVYVREINCSL